ncbi:MAG: vWA domain-containing protein, partial [Myxococcota bacterium]
MRLGMLLVLGSLVGCASDATDGSSEPATTPPPISRGVSLGGAQDIAEFRRIVAEGSVPAPETLDPVGFFAEHAIDLPPATCRGDVCMHPMLAVAPRFNGDNWTMAYLPLNTAVDPTELARPPLHLVIALEQSRNLLSLDTDAALRSLAEGLRAGDRLSFLVFGERPRVLLDGLDPDPSSLDALDAALRKSRRDPRDGTSIAPSTTVGLYEGLARASELATELRGMDGAARVVLISSGQGTGALDTPERLTELAAAYG